MNPNGQGAVPQAFALVDNQQAWLVKMKPSRLDGLTNFLGWGPAHIATRLQRACCLLPVKDSFMLCCPSSEACMYGNMDMLKASASAEL